MSIVNYTNHTNSTMAVDLNAINQTATVNECSDHCNNTILDASQLAPGATNDLHNRDFDWIQVENGSIKTGQTNGPQQDSLFRSLSVVVALNMVLAAYNYAVYKILSKVAPLIAPIANRVTIVEKEETTNTENKEKTEEETKPEEIAAHPSIFERIERTFQYLRDCIMNSIRYVLSFIRSSEQA